MGSSPALKVSFRAVAKIVTYPQRQWWAIWVGLEVSAALVIALLPKLLGLKWQLLLVLTPARLAGANSLFIWQHRQNQRIHRR